MCVSMALEFRQCDDFENVFMCPVYDSEDRAMKNYAEHILKIKVLCATT